MTFDPNHYEIGDIVKIEQTFRVTDVYEDRLIKHLRAVDVKSGEEFVFWASDDTMKVSMVKRKPRPTPKVGDVLYGGDIARRMWKRGTTVRCVQSSGGFDIKGNIPIVLFADGKWHDVEGLSSYEFDDLNPEAKFELLLVA